MTNVSEKAVYEVRLLKKMIPLDLGRKSLIVLYFVLGAPENGCVLHTHTHAHMKAVYFYEQFFFFCLQRCGTVYPPLSLLSHQRN